MPIRYTWLWRKICGEKIVVNDFGAGAFVIGVRIDVCICGFLIGYLNDGKLTSQSVINDWQYRNQTSKKASELARKQKRKMRKKLKIRAWDGADNLNTEGDMVTLLAPKA